MGISTISSVNKARIFMATHEHTHDQHDQQRSRHFPPLLFIAFRWSMRKKTVHQAGLRFAALGIAAGIVALVVVMSVMNGLQSQYIDSLLETTSFHARIQVEDSRIPALSQMLRENPLVRSVSPFVESNILAEGPGNQQYILRVMWIEPQDLAADTGFCRALRLSPPQRRKALRVECCSVPRRRVFWVHIRGQSSPYEEHS